MMKNNRGTCFDSGSMSQENYSCSSPLLSKSTEFLLQNIFRVCMLLLLLLRRFSRVRLCATPERQPTRLPCPWDSPGKNTGVGCLFLLQCMKVKRESEVA